MLRSRVLDNGSDALSLRSAIPRVFRLIVKQFIGFLFRLSPRVHHAIDHGLTIFAFHDVSNKPSEFANQHGLVISTKSFERQILWIKANFEIIHPSTILTEEPLPKRAAVITFDDGYLGTFENGLPILERLGVPSVIFLNMQPILNGTPVLSATASFLNKTSPNFARFCKGAGLKPPFHLSLNPSVWKDYEFKHGVSEHLSIAKFQGEFASTGNLHHWDGHPLVGYGNHLFEHWNAAALSREELQDQYSINDTELLKFSSRINLFAFTNGQPDTCFSWRDVDLLKSLGAGRVFSAAGGVNHGRDEFLLGRIALCESDSTHAGLWFRIGRAVFSKRMPHR